MSADAAGHDCNIGKFFEAFMPQSASHTESELVIRTLYEIASEYDLGFEHQIKRILRLGLTRFNLDIGILSNIRDDRYTIVHQVSPEAIPLADGVEFPLGDTYCSVTMKADGPVGFEYVRHSDISAHPAYRAFGMEAYIGIPVKVKNEVYGTLNFSSPTPQPRAFTQIDIDALKLMAAWVGSELSRRQTETELVQAKEMLQRQSHEDPLTHLYNRRGFEEKLIRLARRCAHFQTSLAGIVIDVDDFKAVNDTFGHSMGDTVLVAISAAISRAVRPHDICGRVGGDEFMVLLPDCPSSEATGIAERIRATTNELSIATDSTSVSPSVSLGVFDMPHDVKDVTEALAVSCESLQQAKKAGKNRVWAK